jgi:oxidoreductase
MSQYKNDIRVGIVGFGWVAQKVWLPAFKSNGRFKIVAYYDLDFQNKNCLYDVPIKACQTLMDLINLRLDLIIIATPNIFHVEYAEKILNHDISVFIEKPICLNQAEYQRLYEAAKASRAQFIPSRASFLRSDIGYIQSLLQKDKSLGRVRSITLEWIRASGIPAPGSWFTDKALAGGGVGYDLGWHMLDVGLSLIGSPEIAEALGFVSKDFINQPLENQMNWRDESSKPYNIKNIQVEDTFIGYIKTNTNVAIHLKVAWASHQLIDHTKIIIDCVGGYLELLTTFGLTPNRIKRPHLTITRRGQKEVIYFDKMVIGNEYKKQVNQIFNKMDNKNSSENELLTILPIVNALEMVYESSCRM